LGQQDLCAFMWSVVQEMFTDMGPQVGFP